MSEKTEATELKNDKEIEKSEEEKKQATVVDVLGQKEFELEQMLVNAKKKAEELVQSAKKQAGEMVVQAKEDREELLKAGMSMSAAEKEKKMGAEKEKYIQEKEKEKEQEKIKTQELRDKYSKNMDKAVKRLVEVVVTGN